MGGVGGLQMVEEGNVSFACADMGSGHKILVTLKGREFISTP